MPPTATRQSSSVTTAVSGERPPDGKLRFGAALTATERRQLEPLVRQPYEFMPDDAFAAGDAEATIFDPGAAIERPTTQWYSHLEKSRTPARALQPRELPLLKAAEERTAFLRYNYCRHRAEQARRSMALPRVATTKGRAMLRWHRRAQHWRELIAEYNLALVLAMARRLPNEGVDYPEMIAEGNLALLRSIDKFRCDRGFKFSTYACRAILKAFSRAGIKEAKHRSRNPVHFEPLLERSNWSDEQHRSHEEDCADALKRIVAENRAGLSDTEVRVVRSRFNLDRRDDTRPPSLEAVGRQIGLTKERVRQIQMDALAKLKTSLEQEFLDGRRVEATPAAAA